MAWSLIDRTVERAGQEVQLPEAPTTLTVDALRVIHRFVKPFGEKSTEWILLFFSRPIS